MKKHTKISDESVRIQGCYPPDEIIIGTKGQCKDVRIKILGSIDPGTLEIPCQFQILSAGSTEPEDYSYIFQKMIDEEKDRVYDTSEALEKMNQLWAEIGPQVPNIKSKITFAFKLEKYRVCKINEEN